MIQNSSILYLTIFATKYYGLRLSGTLVYYKGECIFNTDGYNLEYNLLRLTKLLDEEGELL